MTTPSDRNLERWSDPDVVERYRTWAELYEAELALFERHLSEGMAILDMGVGGGRTTPYLSKLAGRYVGADYSAAMVDACRAQFEGLEFRHCDAVDLTEFADDSFDAVVFSFNGIDYIPTDAGRASCLSETARVLRPDGKFIFSSHNARALASWPLLNGAHGYQIPRQIARAIVKSPAIAIRTLRSGCYRPGEGYLKDPAHGGLDIYVSTPDTMEPQLAAAGMATLETLEGHYPHVKSRHLTHWYYHACQKLPVA